MTGNRSLSALSQGKTPGPEASLGKLVAARVAQEMAAFAMELQGTAGAIGDHNEAPQAAEWQGRYLAIPGMRIAGGTDEILRNIIAERVLGLPPEARADKGIAFKDIPSGPPSK
jgi:acyl-CoA dehydrogenase